jgi:hypothetical protein
MSETIRVNLIVEGQTEETFVREVLKEPLAQKGVYLVARRVETGRKHGAIFRGGMGRGKSYEKQRQDILRWLSQDKQAFVSTMFDLYGLPENFPGVQKYKGISSPYEKVAKIETAFQDDIQNRHFIPYIQLHEFESLLFSQVESIDAVLGLRPPTRLQELQKIRQQCVSPEEINDSPLTAPSKRLIQLYPGYDKPAFGPRIATRIGIETMRKACQHFNAWLEKLESLIPHSPT